MRRAVLLAAVVLAACLPQRTGQPSIGRTVGDDRSLPGANSAGAQRAMGVTQKVVYAKEEPVTLVATDGSRCSVTERRFREAALGDKVSCAWTT